MTNTTPARKPRRKRQTPRAKYVVLLLIALWAVTVAIFIAALFAELPSYVPEYSTTDETRDSNETTTPPEEQVSDYMIIDTDYSYLFTTEKERDYVERVVMQEAGNQPFEGIVAVAQCILNTSLAENCTAYQTVTDEDQYAPPYTKGDPTEEVLKAVSYVFDLGQTSVSEPVRYFYSTKYGYYSSWHETSPNLEYVCTIADHKFFKIKGT